MAATITQPTTEEQSVTRPAPRDYRQEVTDSIIRMLETGVAPWQKPWEPGANTLNTPVNPTSGRAYRGGNAIHLIATAMRKGYEDPRWMTYKQASQEGWQVRRGEKGTQIEFWDVKSNSEESRQARTDGGEDKRQIVGDGAADQDKSRLIHRVYTVFNAIQIEGIPPFAPKQRNSFETVHAGEQILKNSGALIAHDQNDRAFYNRAQDTIHLPPKDAFKDPPAYYGTALHELAHWTGHPTRLNRPSLNESYRFGDLNYAKEELRAELASVFLAAERGIPHNPEQHAAYVASWIRTLKQDKNEIFRAAHDASRASDFLLSLERDRSIADEELTAGSSLDATTGAGLREVSFEQDAANLQRDREDLDESLPDRQRVTTDLDLQDGRSFKRQDSVRESVETTARYEPGSATVNLHAKQNGTDRRIRVDIPVNSPNTDSEYGRPDPVSASLKNARSIAARALGESAEVVTAQTESGNYRGPVIGRTEQHIIQRQSANTAIAHLKQLLDGQPEIGQTVRINYANGHGSVQEFRDRAKAKDLGR
jgi:antirestriction protein ArdC